MEGKVVVITGGSRGLGKSIAQSFISRGTTVIISSLDREELDNTSREIGADAILADVRNEEEVKNLADTVVKKYGRIDVWINNAGVWLPKQYVEEIDIPKAKNLFEVNVFGTLYGMRAVVPHLKKQGYGSIVNIISTTALPGMSGSSGSMYVASKCAISGMTHTVRDELKDTDIKLFGIYPGGIKTELFGDNPPDTLDDFLDPNDVAEKIVENVLSDNPEIDLVLKRPGQIMYAAK